MNSKARLMSEISTNCMSGLDRENTLVVWSIASLEQHGPHLPLGTDAFILEDVINGVREKLGEESPVIFLPQLNYGKSPEHLSFPGTVSLTSTTLLAIADDIVSSLAKHDFKRFAFVSGHGGNSALMKAVSFDLCEKYGVKIYNLDLWAGKEMDTVLKSIFPNLHDFEVHAASLETSFMLYLHPELVGEIPQGNPAKDILALDPMGWLTKDFGQNGVIGDPSHASKASGKVLYEYEVERVSAILGKIAMRK